MHMHTQYVVYAYNVHHSLMQFWYLTNEAVCPDPHQTCSLATLIELLGASNVWVGVVHLSKIVYVSHVNMRVLANQTYGNLNEISLMVMLLMNKHKSSLNQRVCKY